MEKLFSLVFGTLLSVLTVSGFAQRRPPKYFLDVMNVDTQHSVLRVPLTLALLYAGSKPVSLKLTRAILTFVGVFYIVMGTAGTIDRSVGGALPSKLTRFDIVYHYVLGGMALWLGSRSGRMVKP